MPDTLHHAALIDTARLELDRAHRGALAVDGAEIRRGLTLALTALREADAEAGASGERSTTATQDMLTRAQQDLDAGALTELGTLIEQARKTLI